MYIRNDTVVMMSAGEGARESPGFHGSRYLFVVCFYRILLIHFFVCVFP